MPRRTPRLVSWGSVAVLCAAAGTAAVTSGMTPTMRKPSTASSLATEPSRSAYVSPGTTTEGSTTDLFGLQRDGDIAEIVPNDGVAKILATGAAPNGGIAEAPDRRAIFFTTGTEQEYCPAIELKSLVDPSVPMAVVPDAELPAVSPDGSFLAFVTTNDACAQDGVGLVRIDPTGAPEGEVYSFLAPHAPLPMPISGVTVSRGGGEVAFAGGLVDPYLGPHAPTVFVLNATVGTSFESAQHLADGSLGVYKTFASVPTSHLAFKAPVYTLSGTLLVTGPAHVSAFFSEPSGLPVETVVSGSLPIDCVAPGPGADIALVNSAGTLLVAAHTGWFAVSPLSRPSTVPNMKIVGDGYTAVAWTPGGPALPGSLDGPDSTGPNDRTV
jgi:WD40-like Beta Propeller Repeat